MEHKYISIRSKAKYPSSTHILGIIDLPIPQRGIFDHHKTIKTKFVKQWWNVVSPRKRIQMQFCKTQFWLGQINHTNIEFQVWAWKKYEFRSSLLCDITKMIHDLLSDREESILDLVFRLYGKTVKVFNLYYCCFMFL